MQFGTYIHTNVKGKRTASNFSAEVIRKFM
jgi:hypothetical protein